jgi:hypothetical protein
MPWLPLYLFDNDSDILLSLLNDDPAVAFIVSDGVGRWKAIETLNAFVGRRHAIWHIPSGPLPLLAAVSSDADGEVDDPWHGWTERRADADPTAPYFGPGHPGIFWFNLKNHPQRYEPTIGISSFEWIGHRYSKIGKVVEPATDKWWKRFNATIRKLSTKVPRGGPIGAFKPEIYAMPKAIQAFSDGRKADENP